MLLYECVCPPCCALQADATQAALERRAEDLNAAELRVRELQVGRLTGAASFDCRKPQAPCLALRCAHSQRARLSPRCRLSVAGQVRVEQQMRALEAREAELRTVEVCSIALLL